jgi:hypothetical protein
MSRRAASRVMRTRHLREIRSRCSRMLIQSTYNTLVAYALITCMFLLLLRYLILKQTT